MSLINDILKQLEESRGTKKTDSLEHLCGNKLYIDNEISKDKKVLSWYIIVPALLLILSVCFIFIKKNYFVENNVIHTISHPLVKSVKHKLMVKSASPAIKSAGNSGVIAKNLHVPTKIIAAVTVDKKSEPTLKPTKENTDNKLDANKLQDKISSANLTTSHKHITLAPPQISKKELPKLTPEIIKAKPSKTITASTNTASFSIHAVKPLPKKLNTLHDVIELSSSCPGCAIEQLKLMHRSDIEAVHLLAELYMRNGQWVDAEQYISHFLLQYNNYINLNQLLARAYLMQKQPNKSIDILLRHSPSIEQNPSYYNLLGAAYYQNKYYDVASKYFRELTQAFPKAGRYWATYGLALSAEQRNIEAKSALIKAVSLGNLDATLENNVEHMLGVLSRSASA